MGQNQLEDLVEFVFLYIKYALGIDGEGSDQMKANVTLGAGVLASSTFGAVFMVATLPLFAVGFILGLLREVSVTFDDAYPSTGGSSVSRGRR